MASSQPPDWPPSPSAPGAGPRRSRIPATAVVWILTAINVAVWLAMELTGGSTSQRTLIAFGAKVNPLIAAGEPWRLLTAAFLHIGIFHLLFNTMGLLSFGRLAELVYGHARFIAIYLVAGITGSLLSYLLSRSLSAGASGAIFGVAGALAVFYAYNRASPIVAGQGQLGGIIFVLAVNGVYGLVQPGIDNWGHAGGLIGGVALAMWLTPRVSTLTEPDGEVVGYRWQRSSAASWLIVPLVLAIVAVGVARIPGAGLGGR